MKNNRKSQVNERNPALGEQTKEILYFAAKGKATRFKESLQKAFASRLLSKIEERKKVIAKNLFQTKK